MSESVPTSLEMTLKLLRRAILTTAIPHILLLPCASSLSVLNDRRRRIRLMQMRCASVETQDDKMTSHIDKLALILINSKRQHLVARSYNRDVFYTPGGKREPGESDHEALRRECIEELSIDLLSSTKTPATIQSYGTFEAQAFGKPEGILVRMSCFRVTPRDAELELEYMVKASEEVEELMWIDSQFDRDKLTVTGRMILDDLKRKDLIN